MFTQIMLYIFSRMVVFEDDDASVGGQKLRVSGCSLIACETDSYDSCGARVANITTKFRKISIFGTFKNNSDSFYYPISLKSDLSTVTASTYCARPSEQNTTDIQFSTLQQQDQILVFGIIGRSGSSKMQCIGFILMILLSAYKVVLV